ncbi:MAG: glycosyltransferase, partial [Candidatus Altiarchaeales archaeon]|nr:glycosyltransferase [Candidatus Altiarchaeales archaeon]
MQNKKNIAVVIPAYNEQDTVGGVVSGIPRAKLGTTSVVVVDDGSTDQTSRVAEKSGADEIIRFPENRGLGVAFKKGIEKALELNADIIVNIDADMQFNPKDIPKLIDPLIKENADVVVCSRFLNKKLEPSMPWIKKMGNKIFSNLISVLTGVKLTDSQCGFRAYTRQAAQRINIFSTYTYTQESLIDLIEKGMKIKEVACKVKGERKGQSKVVDSIFKYTLRSLAILTRTIRDYRALEFFGTIGASIFTLGTTIAAAMLLRWIKTGTTTPYQSL